jgi:hypothetical protein
MASLVSRMDTLSTHTRLRIAEWLPHADVVLTLPRLSRGWHTTVTSELFWNMLILRDFRGRRVECDSTSLAVDDDDAAAHDMSINNNNTNTSRKSNSRRSNREQYMILWCALAYVDIAGWRWETDETAGLQAHGQWRKMLGVFANRDIPKHCRIRGTGFAGRRVPFREFDATGAFHARLLRDRRDRKMYVVDSGGLTAERLQKDNAVGSLINSPSGRVSCEGKRLKSNVAPPTSVDGIHVASRHIARGQELLVGYGSSTRAIIVSSVIVRWQRDKPAPLVVRGDCV